MVDKIELDIVLIPEMIGESKVYSIYSIQFPNVVTQGETIEDAKIMLNEALNLYFEDMPQEKEKIITIEREENSIPLISRILF